MLPFWIDVEGADGTRYGPGPITKATGWQMTPRLDAAGTFSFQMPVSDPMSVYLANKRIVRCRGIKDGVVTELGAGIIDKIALVPDNPTMQTVSGPDIMAELAGPSVHGLVICELAWSDLSDANKGALAWVRVSATGVPDANVAIPNAHDGNDGTYETIYLMSAKDGYPEHAAYLYIGGDARWDRARILYAGGDYADNAGMVLVSQYYNGEGWVAETIVSDGTDSGGTFRQNGDIVFTRPADWTRYYAVEAGGEWFWRRLKVARIWPDDPSWTGYFKLAEVDIYWDAPTINGVNLIMAYAPDTWTKTGYPDTVSPKYLEFRGQTVLEALVILSEQGGTDGGAAVREHFRLGTGRAIDWMGTTVNASGVRAVSATDAIAAEGAPELALIERLQKETDSAEVVTRIFPMSADQQGIGPATDAAPTGYTRGSITQGIYTFWYLQHTAGYNAYGLIERWVEFSELSLQQADSYTTHPADLGNALQERGAEYLRTHALPVEFYRLSIAQFPALILPGDTIECVYHEWIVDPVTGAVHTVDIDTIRDGAPLHVLAPTLTIDGSGVSVQALEVATIDRAPKTDARVVVDLVRQQRNSGAGASNLASMAASSGGQPPTAGPDIRVSGYQVQRAGAGVLLFSGSGLVLAEYAADATGLAAALAAMSSGDIVGDWVGTITGDFTIPAGGTLRGRGWASKINGQITLGAGAIVQTLDNTHSGDVAGNIIAIVPPESGMAYVIGCRVAGNNATGDGYAVYGNNENVTFLWSRLSAQSAGADSTPFGGGSGTGEEEAFYSLIAGSKAKSLWNGTGNDAPPADWEEIAFDDSAWSAPEAVTYYGYVGIVGATNLWWESGHSPAGTECLVRSTITLAGPVASASLLVDWDDDLEGLYVNGTLVAGPLPQPASMPTYDVGAYLVEGINVIAYHGTETHSMDSARNWVCWRLDVTYASASYPFAYGCVIPNQEGRDRADPEAGDRAAYRTDNEDGDYHALDIAKDALQRHLPLPGILGGLAQSDGHNWQRIDGLALDDLTDVDTSGADDGDSLVFDAVSAGWKPRMVTHLHAYQEDHSSECNGVETEFVTDSTFVAATTRVFLNGLLQRPGAGHDYEESVGADSVVFAEAPLAGDELILEYISVVGTSGGGGGPIVLGDGPYMELVGTETIYLVELHCHSTASDGNLSPAALMAAYEAMGFDAVAITDHDQITADPGGHGMLWIPGDEESPSSGHMGNLFGTYLGGASGQALIDAINAAGGIAILNHPNWSDQFPPAEMASLTGYVGIEIHNTYVLTSPGFAVNDWDYLLTNVRRGIWGFSADDYHSASAVVRPGVGRIRVFAAELTLVAIKAALIAGDFVADVSNDGVTPGIPVITSAGVTVDCPGATAIRFIGDDGVLLEQDAGHEGAYTFLGTEAYVRIEAVGDYTEAFDLALGSEWYTSGGSWSVGSGILSQATDGYGPYFQLLRRQIQGDQEILCDIYVGANGGQAGIIFNATGTTSFYYLQLPDGAKAKLWNNTSTTLATGTTDIQDGTWYSVRIQYTYATGGIKARVWERSGAEPGTWEIEITDTSHKQGMVGLRCRYLADFDNLYINGFKSYYQPIPVGDWE